MTATPVVFDSRSNRVQLGAVVGRGGEGAVYEIAGSPGVVAKIYPNGAGAERAAKLGAMCAWPSGAVRAFTAWPADVLKDQRGAVTGFKMLRVSAHKEVHCLYSPKSRKSDFPEATYKFLVHASANIARAFAVLHDERIVVGDVNHGSVLVSTKDATVRFIDCDSFQVEAGGRPHLCAVGVPMFTPPELQNRSFGGLVRTQNHDAFGLAVTIFHLLFMGRHPFSGRFLRGGDMPIERAIAEYRFAFGQERARVEMEPPPGAPRLESASPAVALLFERAFSRAGVKAGGRPTAREWVAALDVLERQLVRCSANSSHQHAAGLSACPWCSVEQSTGVVLFHIYIPAASAGGVGFQLTVVWAQIQGISAPGALPPLSSVPVVAARPDSSPPKKPPDDIAVVWLLVAIATAVGMIALGPGAILVALVAYPVANHMLGPNAEDVRAYQAAVAALESRLRAAESRWQAAASKYAENEGRAKFDRKLRRLTELRDEYGRLPSDRQKGIERLHAERRNAQFQKFLEAIFVKRADIDGIREGRKATLASYGIETAWDVRKDAVINVPGFGPKLTTRVLEWRRSVEVGFRFDPSRGVDPADVAALDRSLLERTRRIAVELSQGPSELSQLRAQAANLGVALQREANEALQELAQARANLNASRG